MVSIEFDVLLDHAKAVEPAPKLVSAIHSGNGGDIIYSLPAARALGVRHFILNVYKSPDPDRKLSREMALALVPLLLEQTYLDRVTVVQAGVSLESVEPSRINVDYVLDRFRLQDFAHLHLTYAHAKAVRAQIDPNQPFLTVPPNRSEGDRPDLVLALTPRYRGLTDDFVRELVMHFDKIVVLGIPEEWRSVSGIPAEVRKCADMLELAQIIQSAQVFIGNPSLASAVAEGLKVPRIVDLPELCNAFPIGPRGYVRPTRRQAFLDVIGKLCEDNLKVRALYTSMADSLRQARAENAKLRNLASSIALYFQGETQEPNPSDGGGLSLVLESQRFHPVFSGGLDVRIDRERRALHLHPASGDHAEATCRFMKVDLAGFDAFAAEVAVEHEQAAEVRFSLKIYDEAGILLAQSSRVVAAASRDRLHVPFPPQACQATIELSAAMAHGGASADFAWAWIYDPLLLATPTP